MDETCNHQHSGALCFTAGQECNHALCSPPGGATNEDWTNIVSMAGQSDPAGAIDCATVAIAIASDIRGECRVTVQVTAPGGQSSGYAAEDYTCPICLEILLRPIALSCGHRYCRSCWCRMLQGTVRATAMSTGSVACPLGRCSVRPVVPEVEAALARDLAWRFASQLSGRAAPTEAEEMKMVTEVNEAWAAGCKQVPPPTARRPTGRVQIVAPRRPPSRCWLVAGRILQVCVRPLAYVARVSGISREWARWRMRQIHGAPPQQYQPLISRHDCILLGGFGVFLMALFAYLVSI